MPEDRDLDVHSWVVLITFMVVIVMVIRPIRIPLPIPAWRKQTTSTPTHDGSSNTASIQPATPKHSASTTAVTPEVKTWKTKFPYHFTLNIATAPVTGVLFLLATRSIYVESIHNGIVGAPFSGVKPYAVMIWFFSLAYICISLDMTGIFQYAAFWISSRTGGSGRRAFLYFFLLTTVMTILTSNDVVVLTMTPFLVYYSHTVELITPVAFLMSQIQSANIASMAFYIGNLTNVIACQAYKISFLEYSAWMVLPCFASIVTCYIMLRINFRHVKYIPKTLKIPDADPRSCLVDPTGAIFGSFVLACALICLIGTSYTDVSVWMITSPFALLKLARDIWYDSRGNFKGSSSLVPRENRIVLEKPDAGGDASRVEQGLPEDDVWGRSVAQPVSIVGEEHEQNKTTISAMASIKYSSDPIHEEFISAAVDEECNISTPSASVAVPQSPSKKRISAFERKLPLMHAIAKRMPWFVPPFAFSMFIMVEGLSNSGWIAIFATWATKLAPNYIAATYAVGFVAVLLCNIFNNLPMTILVTRVLQHPNFANSPVATPEVVKGCLFALVVGSNLGACTTLIGSMAGLVWDSLLRNKNSRVGYWNFFKWNMRVMPVVIFVALSIVVSELTVMY
ncbi:unnamed protein product [Mortierella alpina]